MHTEFRVIESTPYRPFFESTALVESEHWTMAQANQIRRAIMTEMPIHAIDSGIYMTNTSSMHDDALTQRCGLVPLTDSQDPSHAAFFLNVQAPDDMPLRVMSAHLVPLTNHVACAEPMVELVKLYPGEAVKAIFFTKLAPGSYHAKHAPAHAFHRKAGDAVQLFVRAQGNRSALKLIEQAVAQTNKTE